MLNTLLFPIGHYSKKKLRKNLNGCTILITGASFGIGEALSRELAKNTAAQLILVARTTQKLEELQKELSKDRLTPIYIFTCDLTNSLARTQLINYLRSFSINIFVSNAGKSIRRSVFQSLDRFHDAERSMALNYLAPVELCLYLIPQLQHNKGQIINISAVNIHFPPAAGWAVYQASKIAFDQWARSIAIELRPKGLTFSNIYLPLVRTRMMAPTKMYDNWPAMQPKTAAKLICRAMLTQKRNYQPWWLKFAAFFVHLFSPIWFWVSRKILQL